MSITVVPSRTPTTWLDNLTNAYRPASSGVAPFPLPMANVSRTFASGQLRGMLYQPSGANIRRLPTITSVAVAVGNVGVGVSLCRIGIYNVATNALLASTADFTGALVTGELKVPLSASIAHPTVPVYLAILPVFATTSPAFAAISDGTGTIGANPYFPIAGDTTHSVICQQVGLGDLPNPLVPVFTGDNAMWFGLRGD